MPMSQPSFLPPHQRARLDCNLGRPQPGNPAFSTTTCSWANSHIPQSFYADSCWTQRCSDPYNFRAGGVAHAQYPSRCALRLAIAPQESRVHGTRSHRVSSGIGANTAVFSVAIAFLRKPVSLPNLDRLAMILSLPPQEP
jgi:hypothetical protein